ncbi:MAG: ABC transporter permease subunit, partial [Eubacterium sp.]|nr:ABC transporter permease subunit [Eubacterium sp.]
MAEWFESLKSQFELNFISGDRWKLLVQGLGTTIKITIFAVILGIVLGIVIAVIRSSYDKNSANMHGISKAVFSILNWISKLYLTVIRGTPVVVQLLIMYYIIFASSNNKLFVAILSFGFNSAAYVAEIFRSGIMSIDAGQFEA